MAYSIRIDDQTHRVDVEGENGVFEIKLDDERVTIDVAATENRVYSLIIDGRSYVVDVQDFGDQRQVHVNGEAFVVDVMDERRRRSGGGDSAIAGDHLITSVMPGKVVRLLVEVGQEVKKGEGVIVVEAMKMENELKAPRDGVVGEILVEEGQTVESQAGLLRIE